jgi:late competence protein required for DNA uptake (superfamily II DNA/RNA helicase)
VEKRKTTHDLGASDSEVTQKTIMMLPVMYWYQNWAQSARIINEVMTWLEQQTEGEHLYLLHLPSIQQYVR